jgi:outer membrane protein OmpU
LDANTTRTLSGFPGLGVIIQTEGKLMKKVLFATTALVATAGVAAADVTFGGYGRFGVQYSDPEVGDSSTDVTSRFRLQIDATAESDAGVTFGARVRIQQNEGERGQTNGARFFARSGGIEVGVGNIFGALEFMPGMYDIDLGLTGLGYDYTAYNFRGDAYSSGGLGDSGDNGVEVLYSAGDLSVHVSASDTDDRIAAHAAYKFSGFTVALGLQDSDNPVDTEWALSASGSFGPAFVSAAYAKNGDEADGGGDHWVLAARFDVGAATNIEAYVADADYFAETSYGIDFNHDMGGGTSLRGGIASLNSGETRADFGVRFNF